MFATLIITSLVSSASAFSLRTIPSSVRCTSTLSASSSPPPKDGQEVKDLNLDEMFTVFEKADATVSADEIPKGQVFKAGFSPKEQVGTSGPFGFFDPFAQAPDNEFEFKKFRESELKHGRVAMLAVAGVIIGESGLNFFGGEISGPAIYQFQQAEALFPAFTWNVIGLAAAVEGYNIVNGWQTPSETLKTESGIAGLKDTYVNGDLKFDPLGLKPKAPGALKNMMTKELNNGRLAMIGIAGIVAQELVTGQSIF